MTTAMLKASLMQCGAEGVLWMPAGWWWREAAVSFYKLSCCYINIQLIMRTFPSILRRGNQDFVFYSSESLCDVYIVIIFCRLCEDRQGFIEGPLLICFSLQPSVALRLISKRLNLYQICAFHPNRAEKQTDRELRLPQKTSVRKQVALHWDLICSSNLSEFVSVYTKNDNIKSNYNNLY